MKLPLRTVASGLAATISIALCSCGSAPGATSTGPCPEGWRAAVIFSTEDGAGSELAFVDGDRVIGRRTIPYRGLEASPTGIMPRLGDDVWLVANGNADRDRTDILRFSTKTCDVVATRVTEQVVRALSPASDSFITTNTLNGAAELRRRGPDGELLAENRIEQITLTVLVRYGQKVYALGSTMRGDNDQGILLELDAASLRLLRRTTLLDTLESGISAAIRDGKLFYGRAIVAGDVEGRALGVVSLDDLHESTVALPHPAPFLLAETDDALYVGHTFMNPGFRPMTEYRHVSRYDLSTGAVTTTDVGGPLLSLQPTGQGLLVLSGDVGDAITLTTHGRPGLEPRSAVDVEVPTASGHHYAAGIVTP